MELSAVLKISLENWGKQNAQYSTLYKTLRKETVEIACRFFDEAKGVYKPGTFETWWAREHNRFIKEHKQRELLSLHEIMYHFLTDLARGKLERTNSEAAAKRRKK